MMRRSSSLAGLTVLAALAALGITAPATATTPTTLYANPGGGGTICSHTDPCLLGDAMNQAASGDTIIVEPGSYGSKAHPLTDELGLANSDVTIKDEPGGREPVVYSAAIVGVLLTSGSSLDRLAINYSSGKAGLVLSGTGSAASHVTVRAANAAAGCVVDGGTLTDSLCVNLDPSGEAVLTSELEGTVSATLRGVTAEAPGATGIGILVQATEEEPNSGAVVTVSATNVIAHGGGQDVEATATEAASASATITMAHSDYVTSVASGSPGTASVQAAAGNVSVPPVFVNASKGDYREKGASPTVNAGATDPKGETDLDGRPRTVGSAPDMGSYEFLQRAVIGKLTTKESAHAVTVRLPVNDEGLQTSVKALATHRKAHAKGKTPAGAGYTSKPVTVTVKGLKPHTKYTISVTVSNAGGARHPKPIVVTTR